MGRKIALWILGLVSIISFISLVGWIIAIVDLIPEIGILPIGRELLQVSALAISVAYVSFLAYNSWREGKNYNRYKLAINGATWGILVTIVCVALVFALMLVKCSSSPNCDDEWAMAMILISIFGAIISFIVSVIGLLIDFVRRK